MAVVNTNYKSIIVQNDMMVNNRTLSSAMEQLSTGKRINGAVDDASGVSMSNARAMQIGGLNQAMRNANDGVSMIQTAEGALSEVNGILNRMRELAVQAGNDTNTSADRYALDAEYQQLNREISRISANTQWNGMNVLNSTEVGAKGTSSDVSAGVRNVKFQVGANSNQYINIGLKDFSYTLGVSASTSETKLTLGDLKDKQFFQFTIKQDAINNGSTADRQISFSLDRPIAAEVMTEEELVDFESAMARAINNTDGFSNVMVSRVGSDIYVKDQEGRAMQVRSLTGGSTYETRTTETGFSNIWRDTHVASYKTTFTPDYTNITSFGVTINNTTRYISTAGMSSTVSGGTTYYNPTRAQVISGLNTTLSGIYGSKYTVQAGSGDYDIEIITTGPSPADANLSDAPTAVTGDPYASNQVNAYQTPKYTQWFTLGDIKGKQFFNLNVGNSTLNFQLSSAVAGAALTRTGDGNEMDAFQSAMQTALNNYAPNTYTVGVSGYSLKIEYSNEVHLANLTGGSTVATRGTTWGYDGATVQTGETATVSVSPANTAVFTGTARLNDTRISTHAASTVAVGRIDSAMAAVDRELTTMGSVMNRLAYAGDNAGQISRNTTSSRSRSSDTDYAAATTEVVRRQIIQQASMAMLAQANQVPSSVMSLLK